MMIELSEAERQEQVVLSLELYREYEAGRQKTMGRDGLNVLKRLLFFERWITDELATVMILAKRSNPVDRRPESALGEQGTGERH